MIVLGVGALVLRELGTARGPGTAAELAVRMRQWRDELEEVLMDLWSLGLVVHKDGKWRLA